jgi:hypothetical protein
VSQWAIGMCHSAVLVDRLARRYRLAWTAPLVSRSVSVGCVAANQCSTQKIYSTTSPKPWMLCSLLLLMEFWSLPSEGKPL